MDLFSYNTANGHIKERALQGVAKHVPESGFVENWGEALRLEFDEATSLSRMLNNSLYQERTKTIMDLNDSGSIPDNVIEQHTRYDDGYSNINFDSVARWVNNNLDETIMTDDEIKGNIREDLNMKRTLSEDVYNRANWWGKFGQFIGTTHAIVLDPVLLPTYFMGIGAGARGVTWLGTFGRAAGVAAATEAGMEAVRQPMVYSWKKDIGAEYSFKNAFTQIAAAGFGAGILTGTAAGLADGLKKFLGHQRVYGNKSSAEATKVVENVIREAERSPSPSKAADAHLADLEGNVQRHQTRNSVDADNAIDESPFDDEALFQRDMEAEPEITPEIERLKAKPESELTDDEAIALLEYDKAADAGVKRSTPDDDTVVIMETIEGNPVKTTVREMVDMADDIEKQAEAVRGCI